MPTKTDEKSKVTYENEIITLKETYEKQLDMSKIPVFQLENCEVLYSSLSSKMAKFGHNIQILLPVGSDFPQKDRAIRQNYLRTIQNDTVNGNPNLEVVKGVVKAITDKDILNGKYNEKYAGRYYLDIRVSNTCMFDRTIDENGNNVDKKIAKVEDAIGIPVVKYFRVIDKFTGEGVEPEIFKYDTNGEKITSFVSPKTKQETPLYVNSGDTINISIRPFGTKNNNTNDYSLKYNLLKIEIVQTAWDKGIGRTGGGSKRTFEAPETVNMDSLGDIFGGISAETTTTTPTPTKTATKPVAKEEKAEVKSEPKQEAPKQEVQETVVEDTAGEIDFSALNNMDMSSLNLGE